jgi:hypothetical protein
MAGLKLKSSKSSMFQRRVEFLEHIVSAQGIETQPSKITAVTEWPVPINLTEVRSLLGLYSYYRRFIQRFANIATPLHELLKKKVRFHWGSDQQKAFTLKAKLFSAPVLAIPSDQGTYYLDTDSSDFVLGAFYLKSKTVSNVQSLLHLEVSTRPRRSIVLRERSSWLLYTASSSTNITCLVDAL